MAKVMPKRGRIVTFYSYKGGTGRSMALANFAWILAANGESVLVIDWDLEAPGLHRYFRPFLADPDLFETDGLIDTFWSLAASAFAKTSPNAATLATNDGGEVSDAFEDATRRLVGQFPTSNETSRRFDGKFPTEGYVDFVGAGRQGRTYSERVNSFDWKRFYELGGAQILTSVKEYLRKRYDWILIDSRTGVSDTSGICTMQMPDTVVACFTLNRQSIDGVTAILRSIREFRSSSVDGATIDFFPVAMRIENAEQRRLEVARGYARNALADFIPQTQQSRPREYWDRMEIAYRPAYAFEETLAAYGDATGASGASDTMLAQVEAMAQCISGNDTLRMPEIVEADRVKILEKYALGTPQTSSEKATRMIEPDATDTEFVRSVREKEQIWRKSSFEWRNLLSRRELALLTDDDRRGFGRNMGFYLAQSELMQKFSRRLVFAFFIFWVIGLGVAFATYFDYVSYGTSALPTDMLFYLPLAAFMLGWVVVADRVLSKPYGVRPFDVLRLTLFGPFRPDIHDYVAPET